MDNLTVEEMLEDVPVSLAEKNLDDIYAIVEVNCKNQETMVELLKASNTCSLTLIFVISFLLGAILARIIFRKL